MKTMASPNSDLPERYTHWADYPESQTAEQLLQREPMVGGSNLPLSEKRRCEDLL